MAIIKDQFGNDQNYLNRLGNEFLTDARIKTYSLGALNAEVVSDIDGQARTQVDVRGTFVGTLTPSYSVDGTNFVDLPFFNRSTEIFTLSVTTAGLFSFEVPTGATKIRVRMTAYTSGSALVTLSSNRSPYFIYSREIPTTQTLTATAAINLGVTLNIPASGFTYITGLKISKYCGAALTPTATPSIVTSTNIQGTPSFNFQTAGAIGTSENMIISFPNPLKSLASTNVTFVAPVLTGAIWKITAFYYFGS